MNVILILRWQFETKRKNEKCKKKWKISCSLIEFFLLPIIYSFLLNFLFLIIIFHFTFQSYTSILYLRLPPSFRIILRGKDVEHHNIVNDMMMSQEVTYRPQPSGDGVPKDTNVTQKKKILILYSCLLWYINSDCMQLLSSDDCCCNYWIC